MRKFKLNLDEPLKPSHAALLLVGLLSLAIIIPVCINVGTNLSESLMLAKIDKQITATIPEKTLLMKDINDHLGSDYRIILVINSDLSEDDINAFYQNVYQNIKSNITLDYYLTARLMNDDMNSITSDLTSLNEYNTLKVINTVALYKKTYYVYFSADRKHS